jgi:hypothetical protein
VRAGMEGCNDKWWILSYRFLAETFKLKILEGTDCFCGSRQSRAECFTDLQTKLEATGNNRKETVYAYVITNKCTYVNVFNDMLLLLLLLFGNLFRSLTVWPSSGGFVRGIQWQLYVHSLYSCTSPFSIQYISVSLKVIW